MTHPCGLTGGGIGFREDRRGTPIGGNPRPAQRRSFLARIGHAAADAALAEDVPGAGRVVAELAPEVPHEDAHPVRRRRPASSESMRGSSYPVAVSAAAFPSTVTRRARALGPAGEPIRPCRPGRARAARTRARPRRRTTAPGRGGSGAGSSPEARTGRASARSPASPLCSRSCGAIPTFRGGPRLAAPFRLAPYHDPALTLCATVQYHLHSLYIGVVRGRPQHVVRPAGAPGVAAQPSSRDNGSDHDASASHGRRRGGSMDERAGRLRRRLRGRAGRRLRRARRRRGRRAAAGQSRRLSAPLRQRAAAQGRQPRSARGPDRRGAGRPARRDRRPPRRGGSGAPSATASKRHAAGSVVRRVAAGRGRLPGQPPAPARWRSGARRGPQRRRRPGQGSSRVTPSSASASARCSRLASAPRNRKR